MNTRSLSESSPWLRDPAMRDELLLRNALASSLVEGAKLDYLLTDGSAFEEIKALLKNASSAAVLPE